MSQPEIEQLIKEEFAYFETDEIIKAFESIRIKPVKLLKKWGYSDEEHECWVIAETTNSNQNIVYCKTGFGPDFPWGIQYKNNNDLGNDDMWFAYLYEAYISSELYSLKIQENFILMGPDEREKIRQRKA